MKEFLNRNIDIGILVLRLVIGTAFAFIYGLMKIQGGVQLWEGIGNSMSNLGISFAPVFWGFLAALTEFAGGIFLILGLFTRTTSAFLVFVMFVATIHHLSNLDPWYAVFNPLNMMAVFIALIFSGAGKYSLDYFLEKRKFKN